MKSGGPYRGQCLCGAVQITVADVPVAGVSVCHCYMCQRWSGGLFATFDSPANTVSVTGAVMHHRSSHLSERAFCPKCGSNLWIRDHADDADFELIAGIFPDAATFPLISEIYIDQAPAYVPLAGDHPRKTAAQYEATNPFVKGDTP